MSVDQYQRAVNGLDKEIADRKAMTTASMTAEEIAVQLKELFTPEVTRTIS